MLRSRYPIITPDNRGIFINGDWRVFQCAASHIHVQGAGPGSTGQWYLRRCTNCKAVYCPGCGQYAPEDVQDFMWLKKMELLPDDSFSQTCRCLGCIGKDDEQA